VPGTATRGHCGSSLRPPGAWAALGLSGGPRCWDPSLFDAQLVVNVQKSPGHSQAVRTFKAEQSTFVTCCGGTFASGPRSYYRFPRFTGGQTEAQGGHCAQSPG
jgi:hypothetical protein